MKMVMNTRRKPALKCFTYYKWWSNSVGWVGPIYKQARSYKDLVTRFPEMANKHKFTIDAGR